METPKYYPSEALQAAITLSDYCKSMEACKPEACIFCTTKFDCILKEKCANHWFNVEED